MASWDPGSLIYKWLEHSRFSGWRQWTPWALILNCWCWLWNRQTFGMCLVILRWHPIFRDKLLIVCMRYPALGLALGSLCTNQGISGSSRLLWFSLNWVHRSLLCIQSFNWCLLLLLICLQGETYNSLRLIPSFLLIDGTSFDDIWEGSRLWVLIHNALIISMLILNGSWWGDCTDRLLRV